MKFLEAFHDIHHAVGRQIGNDVCQDTECQRRGHLAQTGSPPRDVGPVALPMWSATTRRLAHCAGTVRSDRAQTLSLYQGLPPQWVRRDMLAWVYGSLRSSSALARRLSATLGATLETLGMSA